MGYIYKITNIINNKCYIGITTKENPFDRWVGHKRSIKNGSGCPALMNAFNKYGENSFKFEVLIICFDNDLCRFEKEYIIKFNSQVPNGYNIHCGGEFGGNFIGKLHTKDTKNKISIKMKEYYTIKEHRIISQNAAVNFNANNNISELMKKSQKWKDFCNIRKNNGTSDETKKKISNTLKQFYSNNKGKQNHSKIMTKAIGKKVLQYSKDNIFIAIFDSIILASEHSGIGRRSIQSNMAGRSKTSGGFIWKYADNNFIG